VAIPAWPSPFTNLAIDLADHGRYERGIMGNTWISDIRDFLDKNDNLAPESGPARLLAEYLCAIIVAVTSCPGSQEDRVTEIRCRRRPRHRQCKGNIVAGYDEGDLTTIVWLCPLCEDNGYIRGWQETQWDKRVFA
jgi:hypothetical protein